MKNQSITDTSPEDITHSAAILETAKYAYRNLAETLQAAITGLKEEPADMDRSKECEAVVRNHFRSLQRVIELEVDLAKRSDTIISGTIGSQLDLESAREEICRRLVKLAEQGGD